MNNRSKENRVVVDPALVLLIIRKQTVNQNARALPKRKTAYSGMAYTPGRWTS
jgi:hypothetical protein